jgi:hypothetical protein
MNRHGSLLGLALTASLALVGCGGGASAAPAGSGSTSALESTPAATDAGSGGDGSPGGGATATVTCEVLLPADEVQSILGVTPKPVDERTYPGSTDCSWSYAKDGAAVQDFFRVSLDTNADDVALWRSTADNAARVDSQTPTSIDGIGDESYTWVGQGDYRKIYVRRGDTTLVISGSSALPVLSTESTMIDFADRLFGRA